MMPFLLFVPLIAAMIGVIFNRNPSFAKYLAFEGSVIALILFPFLDKGTNTVYWFSISGQSVALSATINPLSSLLILIVLLIGPLIFAYSFDFMDLTSEQQRYYFEMLAFEAAMLAFAMAANFILFFIGWEFLSLTSYLLIGFWYNRDRAIRAARKTITIIFIGDLALFASMILFQNAFGTFEFDSIVSGISSAGALTSIPLDATLLLLIAILTKSAQFPFQEWLPDAMEGPTPVSAYLHSTTMVKAGVFAAIILFPLFSAANFLGILSIIGMLTAILSMFNAMREKQVKRVLAYSTLQELGLMFVAIGGGALLAGIYFFFAQSFYKALLFFAAGASMKATGKEDITEMSGLRRNKVVYTTTLFGVLALAGFIPFDGFFANAAVGSAFATNLVVYVLLALINLGTSFYIFRWFTLLSKKSDNERADFNYGLISKITMLCMVVLALATLAASVVFFTLPNMLSSVFFITQKTLPITNLEIVVGLGIFAVGAVAAYIVYRQPTKKSKAVPTRKVIDMVYSSGIMNAIYGHMAAFVEVLANAVAYFDIALDDAFDSVGYLTVRSGRLLRRLAVGDINVYAGIFIVGLIVLVILAAVI